MTEEPTRYDAPNQELVRGDASGPEDQGTGGSPPVEGSGGTQPDRGPVSGQVGPQAETPEPEQPDQTQTTGQVGPQAGDPLDDMTKDELIAEASQRGVDVNAGMTKDEIKGAIRSA